MTALPAETRTVLNIAYKIGVALGRKFEASDLTPELRQAARLYAATYEGDFEYMVGMRDQVIAGTGSFFTDNQSKGILNCLMADAKRRLAAKPQASAAPAATEPAYTKEEEDEFMALVNAPAVKHDAYAEADRANREAAARMAAVKASGRKLTYADIFPEDSVI